MTDEERIGNPANKIMSLETAVLWRKKLSQNGCSLAVTNGCFDLLHRGHAEYLRSAAALADKLLVLINSDDSVRELKGPTRPVNVEYDRAYILSCLRFVDAVVVFSGKRCTAELAALAPDAYAKGGDYTLETLDSEERNALLNAGTTIHFIPFVPGHSTTGTLAKVRGEQA